MWIVRHHGSCGRMYYSSCLLSLTSKCSGVNLCRPLSENRNDPFGYYLRALHEMQSYESTTTAHNAPSCKEQKELHIQWAASIYICVT